MVTVLPLTLTPLTETDEPLPSITVTEQVPATTSWLKVAVTVLVVLTAMSPLTGLVLTTTGGLDCAMVTVQLEDQAEVTEVLEAQRAIAWTW